MKKQQQIEPGRKLTVLRSSQLLRVLGGANLMAGGGGGGATPYYNPYPTTPTPPTMH